MGVTAEAAVAVSDERPNCARDSRVKLRMVEPPPGVFEFSLADSVGSLVARTKTAFSNAVTQRTLREHGITSPQAAILLLIAGEQCELAAKLARELGVDASAVTRLISRLEMHGLLTRERRQGSDRRVTRLILTDKGRSVAVCVPAIFSSVTDELLQDFSREEVGFLKSMLKRMLNRTS